MIQLPSLFILVSYIVPIVFSFALKRLIFANGWFASCGDFYAGASACWLSHMKQ